MYAVGVLIGASGSQMLITSLCLVADLIADNLDSSAFVYGCMSLVDKFSNGMAIMAIQQLTPNPCGCPKVKFITYARLLYNSTGSPNCSIPNWS